MNKEYFSTIKKELIFEYELGIWEEINDFFDRQDILNYSLKSNENFYELVIEMNSFDFNEARNIFSEFVRFIEHDNTFYLRKSKKKSLEYQFLSSTAEKKAFQIDIIFR